ncbi:hypothetical protein HY463_01575 [Candidatus Peregrinibacteria bacterium]|nr:hypothetical protein [Candidatus Peregrinibacteria bacterium]
MNLKNIPTAELHRHFEGGMSAETIARLAQKNHVTEARLRTGQQVEGVDIQSPESIAAYYAGIADGFKKPGGFAAFLNSFGLPLSVMRTTEDLEFAAYTQILEQYGAGNLVSSLRGSPFSYQEYVCDGIENIMLAIRAGVERAYEDSGAVAEVIACFSRQKSEQGPEVVQTVTELHSEDRPMGIDIAGAPENTYPPSSFETMFAPLKEAGVPVTVHAGEQGKAPDFADAPPHFVRDAVEKLGAKRIGHGTSIIVDFELRELLAERGICIEASPISNDRMGFMPMGKSPLKQFLNEGLLVTVNSDDPLMFGIRGTRDMLEKYGYEMGLCPNDILRMTQNAINAAFISPARKCELLGYFD